MTNLKNKQKKPLEATLRNIEVELRQVGQMLLRFQISFSPLLRTAACTNEFYRDIQSFDLVTQEVQELAVVMGNLASVVASEWLVVPEDIVSALVLQALANRICGETSADIGEACDDFQLL